MMALGRILVVDDEAPVREVLTEYFVTEGYAVEAATSGLEALVESTGRTESDSAREAIQEYIERHGKHPTCYDLAKRAGLIGCIDSGIDDLSTNPKHMEGFGE